MPLSFTASTLTLATPGPLVWAIETIGTVRNPKNVVSVNPRDDNCGLHRPSSLILKILDHPGGDWQAPDDGKNILMVDGRQWKRGQPAGGLADKARLIYGSRHEEFIDNVKAFAYFSYAVAQVIDDFQNGEIAMRFKLIEGALDQCAGILFNLKPNGDYLTVRFNGKEDNLVLWTFNKGTRKFVKKGSEDMRLTMKQWYTMKVVIKGTKLEGYLNGKLLLNYTLAEPVTGKIGVWSKTDSVSYFDDYSVNLY
jgi:hypothetical protein